MGNYSLHTSSLILLTLPFSFSCFVSTNTPGTPIFVNDIDHDTSCHLQCWERTNINFINLKLFFLSLWRNWNDELNSIWKIRLSAVRCGWPFLPPCLWLLNNTLFQAWNAKNTNFSFTSRATHCSSKNSKHYVFPACQMIFFGFCHYNVDLWFDLVEYVDVCAFSENTANSFKLQTHWYMNVYEVKVSRRLLLLHCNQHSHRLRILIFMILWWVH